MQSQTHLNSKAIPGPEKKADTEGSKTPAARLSSYFEADFTPGNNHRPRANLQILSAKPADLRSYRDNFILIGQPKISPTPLPLAQGTLYYVLNDGQSIQVKLKHFDKLAAFLPSFTHLAGQRLPLKLAEVELSSEATEFLEADSGFRRQTYGDMRGAFSALIPHIYKKGTPFEVRIRLHKTPKTAEEFYTLACQILSKKNAEAQGSAFFAEPEFPVANEDNPLLAQRDELVRIMSLMNPGKVSLRERTTQNTAEEKQDQAKYPALSAQTQDLASKANLDALKRSLNAAEARQRAELEDRLKQRIDALQRQIDDLNQRLEVED